MGLYINHTSNGKRLPLKGKLQHLLDDGAKIIPAPHKFQPDLVCVICNYTFDAALYCDMDSERAELMRPSETRPIVWVTYAHAATFAS